MERTSHRGALVSVRTSDVPLWTDAKARRMFRGNQYLMERGSGITGQRMASVAKPCRQKRKGRIVRFGDRG